LDEKYNFVQVQMEINDSIINLDEKISFGRSADGDQ